MSKILGYLAQMYGYKKLTPLIEHNFGLIVVLATFICAAFILWRLLNRQFPNQGKEPFKALLMKCTLFFVIGAFVFIAGFTLFYEVKKEKKQTYRIDEGISIHTIDYA